MPADNVPVTSLNALYNNTTGGITADPVVFDAAMQDVVNTTNKNAAYVNSLVTAGILSPLPPADYNQLINGGFDVWEHGLSFVINNLYTADRWHVGINATTSPGTISRQSFTAGQTQVPNNPKYFMRINPTGFTGCSYFVLQQPIEGVESLSGGKATLSFWAKADSMQNISAQLIQSFGTVGTPSADVPTTAVVNSLDTDWTKYSMTFDVPSISGKTLGTNGDSCLRVVLNLPKTGTFSIDLAQIQLCAGDAALPIQPRSFAHELALCQRYYYRIDNDVASARIGLGSAISTTVATIEIPFPTTMRVIPSLSFSAINGLYLSDGTVATVLTACTTKSDSHHANMGTLTATVASGLTQFRPYYLEFNPGGSKFLAFDAEL